MVKSHARNRIKLESTFANLSHSWKTYKADLDLPETAFNEEVLEKPAVYDSEEDKFITQKAQQYERLAITLHNQP